MSLELSGRVGGKPSLPANLATTGPIRIDVVSLSFATPSRRNASAHDRFLIFGVEMRLVNGTGTIFAMPNVVCLLAIGLVENITLGLHSDLQDIDGLGAFRILLALLEDLFGVEVVCFCRTC